MVRRLSMIFCGLIVLPLLFLLLQNAGVGTKDISSSKAFTIIALPDTQVYSRLYHRYFDDQTSWIVENKEKLNIAFVTHLGDIVDTPNSSTEWAVADQAIGKLHDRVPYGIAPGNHDFLQDGSAPLFDKYFDSSRINYAQGFTLTDNKNMGSNRNSYHLLIEDSMKILAINLEFCPSDSILEETANLLERYKEYTAILSTHSFLDYDGTRTKSADCQMHVPTKNNAGNEIWEYLFEKKKVSNLALILSGHRHIEGSTGAFRRSDLINGRMVHQLLANYQHLKDGGEGYLRMLIFYPDLGKVHVSTYSPTLNKYYTDPTNEFDLSLN